MQRIVSEVFDSWPRMMKGSFLSSIWVVMPSLVISELWIERNGRIFVEKSESLERVLWLIEHSIEEVVSSVVS